MAINVVWLDQAKDDVKDFLAYLYPKNPSAALSYIDDLESYTRLAIALTGTEPGRKYLAISPSQLALKHGVRRL